MFGKILSSTVNICAYEFKVYSFLYVIKYIIVNDYFCHLCGVILTLKNNGCDIYNRYRLINHGDKIIPAIHKELYILPRPSKAMAQWKFQYMQKEVYILSRPPKLQPVADYSIVTQYTHREKDQDLPQLLSTLEAQEMYQYTHQEPATAISQALIASNKRKVDQHKMVIKPKVYRRTRTMLKVRCTDVRQIRHNYSQLTESEKAKFQTAATSNAARNYVEHNSVEMYHRTLSTQQNQILLLLLLLFQNQKKGRKSQKQSQKLQLYLHLHLHIHLHLHWRELRNSPTLQDPESQ